MLKLILNTKAQLKPRWNKSLKNDTKNCLKSKRKKARLFLTKNCKYLRYQGYLWYIRWKQNPPCDLQFYKKKKSEFNSFVLININNFTTKRFSVLLSTIISPLTSTLYQANSHTIFSMSFFLYTTYQLILSLSNHSAPESVLAIKIIS